MMSDGKALDVIETFIGKMRLRMTDGGSVSYNEFADVVEALYCIIQKKKDK